MRLRRPLSRRTLLAQGAAFGAFTLLKSTADAIAQAPRLRPTPFIELGPFYPVVKPLDRDADLTLIQGRAERAKGQVIHLLGRVLTRGGEPMPDASVELWQANTFGRYNHPSDPNPAAIDPNFQGYALQTTDSEGRFRFKTIKPAGYPAAPDWKRAPHIHFDITGKTDRTVTQMFFEGDELNDQDRVLQSIRFNRESLFARPLPPLPDEPNALVLSIDLVMFRR